MSFRDLNLNEDYDSERDDPLNDFYIPVFSNSKEYYRMAGYFNSKSLAYSARGLKDFIINNSKMKLLCGVELTSADLKAIMDGETNPEEFLTDNFLEDINNIEDEIRKNHVKVLGWMIANGLLEIKVVVMGLGELDKGIMHYKVGINRDFEGNYICFSGSINETSAAWKKNLEQFEVYRSWHLDENERILNKIDLFKRTWEGKSGDYKTIDVPTAVKEKLIEIAPDNFDELVFSSDDSLNDVKNHNCLIIKTML